MESPEVITFSDDFDSACSTPFVSAPSSPGRTSHPTGFFYSAPASPIHYMISSSSSKPKGSVTSPDQPSGPFEFEFTRKQAQTLATASMTSADELFFNGQIRPMKLSSHLQRPQVLSPLLDIHNENENENENENDDDDDDDDDVTEEPVRGRDYRSKSLRRRARSMSPLRTCEWLEEFEHDTKQNLEQQEDNNNNNNNTMNKVKLAEMETTPSGASSRSSSLGRSSKRWVFLKEFLYRSKSEGRTSTSTSNNNNNTNNIKFWTSLSFSPNKEKKLSDSEVKGKGKVPGDGNGNVGAKKAVNGVSNRRLGRSARSAHEVHYTLNRAQSEEMRRKTYLPYKQGLLGCLGFSSKSYGAMNGFARALNPVSSR